MLALLLHLPLFAVLVALYIAYPARHRKLADKWRHDLLVIVVAVLISVGLMLWVGTLAGPEHSGVWPLVLDALVLFHSFPLLLALGWWLRERRVRRCDA